MCIEMTRINCDGQIACKECNERIEGEWLQVAFKDSGDGIPLEIQSQIFEPFYTTKDIGKGSGLGLSQVAGIVAQHAGHIQVESTVGKGACFSIYFPLAAPSNPAEQMPEEAKMQQGNGETILLVEDDSTVLDAMTEMLELLGYKLLTAPNGEQAIKTFHEHKEQIALVVSDMVMPDIDGEALYRELKITSPELKMIIMSAYPLGEQGSHLLEQGLVSWFKKPVSFGQLAQIIGMALSNRKGRYC